MSDELVIRLRGAVLKAATLIGPANPAAVFELGEAAEALAARVAKLEEALTWYEDFDPDAVEAIKAKVEALDAIRALAPSREGEGKE